MVKSAELYFALQKDKLLLSKQLAQLIKQEDKQKCDLYRSKQEHMAFWGRMVSSSGHAFPQHQHTTIQNTSGKSPRSISKRSSDKNPGVGLSGERRCFSWPVMDRHPTYLQRYRQEEFRRSPRGIFPCQPSAQSGKKQAEPRDNDATTKSSLHGYSKDKIRVIYRESVFTKQTTTMTSQVLRNYSNSGNTSAIGCKPSKSDVIPDQSHCEKRDKNVDNPVILSIDKEPIITPVSGCDSPIINADKRKIGVRIRRTKYLLRRAAPGDTHTSATDVKCQNKAGDDGEICKQTRFPRRILSHRVHPPSQDAPAATPTDSEQHSSNQERKSNAPNLNFIPATLSRKKEKNSKQKKTRTLMDNDSGQEDSGCVDKHPANKRLLHRRLSVRDSSMSTSTVIDKQLPTRQHGKSRLNILPTWVEEDTDCILVGDTDPERQLGSNIALHDATAHRPPTELSGPVMY